MKRAFSLLEVMISLAILSMGMVMLLQVQSRSMQLAVEANAMTTATQLTRSKMLDCQYDLLKKGFSIGDYNESGNFGDDGFPTYYWECHAYEPKMPEVGGGDVSGLTGGAGGDEAGGGDVGMGFLQPILGQMSGIMGKSVRELVVIVRWGEGEDRDEMEAVTHVVDKQPVTTMAQLLAQQCRSPLLGGGATPPAGDAPPGGASPPSTRRIPGAK
jgi:general secretion pathway protein I